MSDLNVFEFELHTKRTCREERKKGNDNEGLRQKRKERVRRRDSGFGDLVVSMLASGTRVRGFEPDRSC